MSTPTNVCNFAIGHLGIGKQIGNYSTEQSPEAMACRTFYDLALNFVLRAWDWPFAKKYATLAMVAENPALNWSYAYQYPSDCLNIRALGYGLRVPMTQQNKIPYELGSQSLNGQPPKKLIFTNANSPEVSYTRLVNEVNFWPPDFMLTMSAYLAHLIAPRLTSVDSGQSGQMLGLYERYFASAKSNAYNEEASAPPAESEFIRAREGGDYYGEGYGPWGR